MTTAEGGSVRGKSRDDARDDGSSAAGDSGGRVEVGADDDGAVLARALEVYAEASQFRRRAMRALRPLNLTFSGWRVLVATCAVVARNRDACSHADVSRELALDEASVHEAMHSLSRRGWVSHDIGSWRVGFRVFPTAAGRERLNLANHAVLVATTQAGRARLLRRLFAG